MQNGMRKLMEEKTVTNNCCIHGINDNKGDSGVTIITALLSLVTTTEYWHEGKVKVCQLIVSAWLYTPIFPSNRLNRYLTLSESR